MRATPRTWPRACTNNRKRAPPKDTRPFPTPFPRMTFPFSTRQGRQQKSDNLRRLSTFLVRITKASDVPALSGPAALQRWRGEVIETDDFEQRVRSEERRRPRRKGGAPAIRT